MSVNLAVGQVTPPVAVHLFVAAKLGADPAAAHLPAVVPSILAMVGARAIMLC